MAENQGPEKSQIVSNPAKSPAMCVGAPIATANPTVKLGVSGRPLR